jgi:superfamily I DNA/RNA helicase
MSWRSAGIDLGGRQIETFKDNYRNTAQIARLAISLAKSPYMRSSDADLVEPVQPTAAGPIPTLIKCRDKSAEAATIRDFVKGASRDQKVAILLRKWADAWIVDGLPYTRLRRDMNRWDESPGLYVGAYHSAKGLEFDAVVMPFLSEDTVPDAEVLDAYIESEACAREARLLYVAVTRAKSSLVMTYSGKLTRLLGASVALCDEVDIS